MFRIYQNKSTNHNSTQAQVVLFSLSCTVLLAPLLVERESLDFLPEGKATAQKKMPPRLTFEIAETTGAINPGSHTVVACLYYSKLNAPTKHNWGLCFLALAFQDFLFSRKIWNPQQTLFRKIPL
jgi:hypothetical protein